jgi:uncharacterized membrane protein HdeD (DUF308 family)
MDASKKFILQINLAIFSAYTLIAFAYNGKDGSIVHAFLIAGHFIICMVVGLLMLIFTKDQPNKGGAFIMSAGLILLIGFGTCMGLNALINA